MKSLGLTEKLLFKLLGLRLEEESGTASVRVKSVDIGRNVRGKPALWFRSDAEGRKLGEQTGLDTLVVLAVNDGH